MRIVPLADIPNQSLTLTVDGVRWGLRFVTCGDALAADVDRGGNALLRGVRVVSGEPVIPYRYLQTGNFIFISNTDDLPQPTDILVYLSPIDIALIMANPLSVGETTPQQISYLTSDEGFYLTTDAGALLEDT